MCCKVFCTTFGVRQPWLTTLAHISECCAVLCGEVDMGYSLTASPTAGAFPAVADMGYSLTVCCWEGNREVTMDQQQLERVPVLSSGLRGVTRPWPSSAVAVLRGVADMGYSLTATPTAGAFPASG
jgi:hypothetical protein